MRWVLANLDVIGSRTLAHLGIAVPAIVLSVLLALPLGAEKAVVSLLTLPYIPVSYTHLTLPTNKRCRSRWSPYH